MGTFFVSISTRDCNIDQTEQSEFMTTICEIGIRIGRIETNVHRRILDKGSTCSKLVSLANTHKWRTKEIVKDLGFFLFFCGLPPNGDFCTVGMGIIIKSTDERHLHEAEHGDQTSALVGWLVG